MYLPDFIYSFEQNTILTKIKYGTSSRYIETHLFGKLLKSFGLKELNERSSLSERLKEAIEDSTVPGPVGMILITRKAAIAARTFEQARRFQLEYEISDLEEKILNNAEQDYLEKCKIELNNLMDTHPEKVI